MYPFCEQNEQNRQVEEDFTTLRVKCPAFLEDLANYIRAAVEMDWASLTGVVGYVEKHLDERAGEAKAIC